MCEIQLDSYCRLCLKESFSLVNIFTRLFSSEEPVSRILNFVYDVKICEDDGLPCKICFPCVWRMLEFQAYKKNVHYAESEIMKLLGKTRLNSEETSVDEANDDACIEAEDVQTDVINELQEPQNDSNAISEEVNIKEEMEIVEWQIPDELKGREFVMEKIIGIFPSENEVEPNQEEYLLCVEEMNEEQQIVGIFPSENVAEQNHEQYALCVQETNNVLEVVEENRVKMEEENYDEGIISNQLTEELVEGNGVNLEGDNSDEGIASNQLTEASKESKVSSTDVENEVENNDNIYVEDNSSLCNTKESFEHIDGENSGEGDKVQPSASELNCTEKEGDSGLSGQTATVKGKDLSYYVCDICNRSCKTKWELGRHVTIHYEDRPYACRICGKRFKQQDGRNKHEILHRKQQKIPKRSKLYTCGICGKHYCNKVSLYYHSNVHTKRYCCSVCGKCFHSNGNLQSHVRTHTKEKPFKCDICQKCFSQKGSLKGHVATHSSERPFSCNICGKMFKYKRTKQLHELIHQKKI